MAGLVPAVPGPVAVRVQPPGGRAVVHAEVEQAAQPPLMAGVGHQHEQFHPAVQVPVHHVGAADPDLAVVVVTDTEGVDAGVLEEPAEYAADRDPLRQPGDTRPQRADAPDPQVDADPGLGGPVERVDHYLVDERVGLEDDPGGQAGPAPFGLPVDPAYDAVAQFLRGDQQPAVRTVARVPGEVVEQGGDVLADGRVGGEQAEVLV